MIRRPPRSTRTDTLFPYTTLFRAQAIFRLGGRIDQRTGAGDPAGADDLHFRLHELDHVVDRVAGFDVADMAIDIDRDRRVGIRSAERREGKACASTCRYRWQTYHKKQTTPTYKQE